MTEIPGDGDLPVKLPSGTEWRVQTIGEQRFVREKVKAYGTQFKFHNVSDLSGLDQIIQLETLIHRMTLQLSIQRDYWGQPIADEGGLRRQLKDLSGELRQLKASLRLDRDSRSQDDQADTISYISLLLKRAGAFGIMRDKQTAKAIELFQQLLGLCTTHFNCTEQERKEMKLTSDDIVNWVHIQARGEFVAVDKHFRDENKTMWFPQPNEGL